MKEIDSIIKNLKESPIFNLSLSSRELFHSNFLYWIANNYPSEFGSMFTGDLKKEMSLNKNNMIKNIQREKGNIDLSFEYDNSQKILIENKVKSIPYLEQLERYSENSESNENFILLSLTEPNFDPPENWKFMSYGKLHTKLNDLIKKLSKGYHKEIIKDYTSFISELVKIDELCKLDERDYFDFHSIKANNTYKKLQQIRLHDLFLKKKYELFAHKIFEKLESKKSVIFGKKHDWKANDKAIFINHGMTMAQGLTDIKYKITDNVLLCIQIQGEHFRLAIEDKNGKTADKIKSDLLNEKLWFRFDGFKTNNLTIYPTNKDKIFNQFGKVFYYQSIKLGTEFKISELVAKIKIYLEHIDKNYERIQSLALKEK